MNRHIAQSRFLKRSAGFTLIEVLISITIFTIFMTIISGLFVGILRSQKRVSALLELNDNMSLALEHIAREIRFGSNFAVEYIGQESDKLSFSDQYDKDIAYTLTQRGNINTIGKTRENVEQDMVSSNVNITYMKFEKSLNYMPLIRVSIGGKSTSPLLRNVEINLQTSIAGQP